MKKIDFVCNKKITHNGTLYKPGQVWDGDLPPPSVGSFWSISQFKEPSARRQVDSIATGSSRGQVGWKQQPDRPRAAPLTAQELAILEKDPYANLDEAAAMPAAPDPPPTSEKKRQKPIMSLHLQMSDEERDDPYGTKARAAARTAELQAERVDVDPLADPDKE